MTIMQEQRILRHQVRLSFVDEKPRMRRNKSMQLDNMLADTNHPATIALTSRSICAQCYSGLGLARAAVPAEVGGKGALTHVQAERRLFDVAHGANLGILGMYVRPKSDNPKSRRDSVRSSQCTLHNGHEFAFRQQKAITSSEADTRVVRKLGIKV